MGPDLKGATPVYGSSRAAWYLKGRYYDRHGQQLSHEEAAQPNPDDPPRPPEPPPPPETVPRYYEAGSEPAPVTDEMREQARANRLRKMSAAKVADLVRRAGGEPQAGHGSKSTNMRWLLEHTT